MGLSSRSETDTRFNGDVLSDRRQLCSTDWRCCFTFLPTELGFTQRTLG
jgi:hypothetical protein